MIRYLILGEVLEIHRLVDPVDGKLESAIAQRLAHATTEFRVCKDPSAWPILIWAVRPSRKHAPQHWKDGLQVRKTPQDSHNFQVTAVTNHAQNIQHFGIKKVGLLPKTVIALIPK